MSARHGSALAPTVRSPHHVGMTCRVFGLSQHDCLSDSVEQESLAGVPVEVGGRADKQGTCSDSSCRFIWQVCFPGSPFHPILAHYLPFGTTIVGLPGLSSGLAAISQFMEEVLW
jgi:hypothetical protein